MRTINLKISLSKALNKISRFSIRRVTILKMVKAEAAVLHTHHKHISALTSNFLSQQVPARRQISFSFTTFFMGDTDGCPTNYVELRNGLTEGDRLVGRYCGSVSRLFKFVCVCLCNNVYMCVFLPPASEGWGKVMFLQVCVCPRGVCVNKVEGLTDRL